MDFNATKMSRSQNIILMISILEAQTINRILMKKNTIVEQFIYLGFNVAFQRIVQVISQWVVLWAEETSTYSWSRFCTVN